KSLRRRVPGLEYGSLSEWKNGVRHTHILLTVPDRLRKGVLKEASEVAGLRATHSPVRSVPRMVRYFFKHLKGKRAELPPAGFRGRLVNFSRGFLRASVGELWKQVKADLSRDIQHPEVRKAESVMKTQEAKLVIDSIDPTPARSVRDGLNA